MVDDVWRGPCSAAQWATLNPDDVAVRCQVETIRAAIETAMVAHRYGPEAEWMALMRALMARAQDAARVRSIPIC